MTTIDRRYSVAEGTAVKAPCRVATTANITLSGLQTIDGVTLVDRDRVLVRSQSTASENGIYEASSGNWSRAKDFDGAHDVVRGTRVYVHSGTTYAGREFVVTTADTITIDTSSITFSGSNPTSGNVTRAFDTYADMLAASFSSGDVVLLLGYTSVGDGGGGEFAWVPSSSATHNGGTIVRPTAYASSNGRLLRIFDGSTLNVKWFGVKGDGSTDDTTNIQAALTATAAYQTLFFPAARYYFNGCISSTTSNIRVDFGDASFLVGDTGTSGTTTNGTTDKYGFMFQSISNLNISGSPRFIGQGTLGTTRLAGVVFDACTNAQVPGPMYFEGMAAGRVIYFCNRCNFGDVFGRNMYGAQDGGTAGSVEVVVGCKLSTFGTAYGFDVWKPTRYLSVAADSGGSLINNEECVFGSTISEQYGASDESIVLALRSSLNCTFGSVIGDGVSSGLYIIQYATENGSILRVDGNFIESIVGSFGSTGSSGDSIVTQTTLSTVAMGSNTVGSINAIAAGESGIYCDTGELTILDAIVSGGTQSLFAHSAKLTFGRLVIKSPGTNAVLIGQNLALFADIIDIRGGYASGSPAAAFVYDTTYGSGGIGTVSIGVIRYLHSSIGTNFSYVVRANSIGVASINIGHVDGTGATGQCLIGGDAFTIARGSAYSTVPPAGAVSYARNNRVWNSEPSSGGAPGWVCTTAGSPGTWRAMANLA